MVFQMKDGSFGLVKLEQNRQGARVLVNEFVCGKLAEKLRIPVGSSSKVRVRPEALDDAKRSGHVPDEFQPGVHWGVKYFTGEKEPVQVSKFHLLSNVADIPSILMFDSWIIRGDSRQAIMLVLETDSRGNTTRGRLLIYDQGFAFGGTPHWTIEKLNSLRSHFVVNLENPWDGMYASWSLFEDFVERLASFTKQDLDAIMAELAPPIWGLTEKEADALSEFLLVRINPLIDAYRRSFTKYRR